MNGELKDCTLCEMKRALRSRRKGVRIPDGTGKCIRPGGHCDPDIVPGQIGEGARVRRRGSSDAPEIPRDEIIEKLMLKHPDLLESRSQGEGWE